MLLDNDQIRLVSKYFSRNKWCVRAGVNAGTVKSALHANTAWHGVRANPQWREALFFRLKKDIEQLNELVEQDFDNDTIRSIGEYVVLSDLCRRAGTAYNTLKTALHDNRAYSGSLVWRLKLQAQLKRDIERIEAIWD